MTAVTLQLLGAFEVRAADGASVACTPGSQRLIAFLALRDRTVSRVAVADTLWPDASNKLGAVCLRSALVRLDPVSRELVRVTAGGLSLAPGTTVDYRIARVRAENILDGAVEATVETASETRATIAMLCRELLPDFYDNWVLGEAEDWRLLRAAALESLAETLSHDREPYLAMYAARAAIRSEPLRETAHIVLTKLHISAGNHSEALRAFGRFRNALADAANVGPSAAFCELIDSLPVATTHADYRAVSAPLPVEGMIRPPDTLDYL